jgi:hypothetical protein
MFEWPKNILDGITFELIEAKFPKVKYPLFWKEAFKPCASERLFYSVSFFLRFSVKKFNNFC